MMIDASELADGSPLEADLCIVGAGAAGIALALQFIDSPIRVLLLESGGTGAEDDTQALYAGQVEDDRLHPPPDRYRNRRFGGSTTSWGGRCMPFDAIDFEPRDYMANSGWPIAYDTLRPYYARASRLCEAGEFQYTERAAFPRGLPPLIDGFASTDFASDRLERFSCPTDFGARYGHRLSAAPNIRVLLHANVTALRLDESGVRVVSADVATLNGKRYVVRARDFVLATGGLEVARLLLASRDVQPNGIGNAHDVVGRYYMCHLAGSLGTLRVKPGVAVHYGYDLSADGIYCRRRFALRDEAQRQMRCGNFVARLHHPRITEPEHRSGALSLLFLAKPFIPYEYAKRLHGDGKTSFRTWLAHARNLLADPFQAFAIAWQMLTQRKLAERKFPSIIVKTRSGLFSIDFHAEQEPNPDSRVSLCDEVDALGMPQLKIDWRYTAADVDTVRLALAALARDFEASGVGHLDYDPEQIEFEMLRYGAYGGHHIGTARMGSDPRSSVVDSDTRVHGVDNLFIASAATFTTSSQANPTLTIVAMSLRLAEHLRARLQVPLQQNLPAGLVDAAVNDMRRVA